jgi:hypothetical protein
MGITAMEKGKETIKLEGCKLVPVKKKKNNAIPVTRCGCP